MRIALLLLALVAAPVAARAAEPSNAPECGNRDAGFMGRMGDSETLAAMFQVVFLTKAVREAELAQDDAAPKRLAELKARRDRAFEDLKKRMEEDKKAYAAKCGATP